MFGFFKKERVPEFPEGINVEKIEPADEEILEEWARILHKNHMQFHSVDAIRVADKAFPFYLSFGAGEFIREMPFVEALNEAIYDAIMSVSGVETAFHEDTETYVITGTPNGEALVYEVAKAIDQYIKGNIDQWDKAARKL
jgi:hypothetical protein